MFDKSLAIEIVSQIFVAGKRIERRFVLIESPDKFLDTDNGLLGLIPKW